MSLFLQQLFNGIALASLYALVGIGITLVYGLTRLINFAHGELVMIAALITVYLATKKDLGFYASMGVALLAVAILSLALERFVFRPTFEVPLNGFIASLGLILVLQGAAFKLYGPGTTSLDPPFPGVVSFGDVHLAAQRIAVIVITVPILVGFFALLRYTKVGIGVRAVAIDPEAAAWMGIPVKRMIAVTFAAGGVLAAIAGALDSTLYPVNTLIGGNLVVKGFAVALLGGLGNVAGAVAAALILGLAETFFSGYVLSEWTDAFAFGVIVLVLLVRPQGLFRGTEGAAI
jgi:branched-chain amino acid transport system permease protein